MTIPRLHELLSFVKDAEQGTGLFAELQSLQERHDSTWNEAEHLAQRVDQLKGMVQGWEEAPLLADKEAEVATLKARIAQRKTLLQVEVEACRDLQELIQKQRERMADTEKALAALRSAPSAPRLSTRVMAQLSQVMIAKQKAKAWRKPT